MALEHFACDIFGIFTVVYCSHGGLVQKHCCCYCKRTHGQLGAKPFAAGSLPLGTSFPPLSDTVSTCNTRDKTNLFSTVPLFSLHQTKPIDFCFQFCFQTENSSWVRQWLISNVHHHEDVSLPEASETNSLRRNTFHLRDASEHPRNMLLEYIVGLHQLYMYWKGLILLSRWVQTCCISATKLPLKQTHCSV